MRFPLNFGRQHHATVGKVSASFVLTPMSTGSKWNSIMQKPIILIGCAFAIATLIGSVFAIATLREGQKQAFVGTDSSKATASIAATEIPCLENNDPAFNSTDPEILSYAQNWKNLTQITEEPHLMDPSVSHACGGDGLVFVDESETRQSRQSPNSEFRSNVHGDRFCDVFVSENAKEVIRSGEGEYPTGAVIVKTKFPDRSRKIVELFTVMRKMQPGYSPEHGNWEYSVIDAEAQHVLARGKITSCIQCHESYSMTDFVTRAYFE